MITVDLSHLLTGSQSVTLNPAQLRGSNTAAPEQNSSASETTLAPITTATAHKVLSKELLDSINKALESTGAKPVESLYAQDFTPENIASRLTGHVNGILADLKAAGAEDQTITNALQEMQKGLAMGFAQAREMLQGLHALTDDVAQQIDATEALVKQGMLELAAPATSTAAPPPLTRVMYAEAESLQESSSATLQLQTKDGDVVNITLNKEFSTSTANVLSVDADGMSYGMQKETRTNTHLSIEVTGELDKKELSDIHKLMKRIDKMTDKAADGNLHSALKTAMKLGNNTSEIASFSVDMSMQSARQSVMEMQTTTSQPTSAPIIGNNLAPVPNVTTNESLLAETDEIARETDQLGLFADPQSIAQQLVVDMLEIKLGIKGTNLADSLLAQSNPGRRDVNSHHHN